MGINWYMMHIYLVMSSLVLLVSSAPGTACKYAAKVKWVAGVWRHCALKDYID